MSQSLKALWVRVCVGGKFPGCLLFIHFALAVWAVRLCLHHYHLHINARKHRPAFNHLFMGLIYYLRELLGGQVGKHTGHACCAAPPSVFTCRAWRAAHNWGQAVAIWSIVECRLEFFEPRSSFFVRDVLGPSISCFKTDACDCKSAGKSSVCVFRCRYHCGNLDAFPQQREKGAVLHHRYSHRSVGQIWTPQVQSLLSEVLLHQDVNLLVNEAFRGTPFLVSSKPPNTHQTISVTSFTVWEY